MPNLSPTEFNKKKLKHFFIQIFIFSGCIPLCVCLIFLYFILKSNIDKTSQNHEKEVSIIENVIRNSFERITDSLDFIAQSHELVQLLESPLNHLETAEDRFGKFLYSEKNRLKSFAFSYCFYGSQKDALYLESECSTPNSPQSNGIQFIEEIKTFLLYKTYPIKSKHGEHKILLSAQIPFSDIQKSFFQLESLILKSTQLTPFQLEVILHKSFLNSKSLKVFGILILICMVFFLLSILYGMYLAYGLTKNAEHSLKLAVIGRVAHFLAHDIKKPFQNLKFFTKELSLCTTQEQAENLISTSKELICSSHAFIENTIDDLISADNTLLNLETHISIRQLINECVEVLIKHLIIKPKISTNYAHTFSLHGDKKKLKRVFLNLISNALDETKNIVHATISIHTFDYKSSIRIIVHNTHSFIKKQRLKQIFEPFMTTKGEHGNGLGLPIAKKCIDLHKGKISCHSTKKSGVSFSIDLPAYSGNLIIIIDDCPLTLRSWTRYFLKQDPHLQIKTFVNFELFFSWYNSCIDKKIDIREIICDFCVESTITIHKAVQKINKIFNRPVSIASHMDKSHINRILIKLNYVIINKI